jgi:transposase
MTIAEYEKHLVGELCWSCHEATHKCASRQRQCPRCRRKISYHQAQRQWALLRAFVLQASANSAAKSIGVSYPTAHAAFRRFRETLADLAAAEDRKLIGEIEVDESYFGGHRKGHRGRGAAGKVAVFWLLERKGRVYAIAVSNCSKEILMGKIRHHAVKGAVFYTDDFVGYNDLHSFGKHLPINHRKVFANGRAHINGIEGFWSFAKQMFAKCHGVDPINFPLYLKEYEFRYNHRNEDLIQILFEHLISPKLTSKPRKFLP